MEERAEGEVFVMRGSGFNSLLLHQSNQHLPVNMHVVRLVQMYQPNSSCVIEAEPAVGFSARAALMADRAGRARRFE